MSKQIVIVGAGPAGIFCGLRLSEEIPGKNITIVEKGKPISQRNCPLLLTGKCINCVPCSMISGWGGAGAYSDGKLNITGDVGGFLVDILGKEKFDAFVPDVLRYYEEHGASQSLDNVSQDPHVNEWNRQARLLGMRLITFPIKHLGTDKTKEVLANMYRTLIERGAKVLFNQEVEEIGVTNGKVTGVKLDNGNVLPADYVVVAVGRSGADNLTKWVNDLHLSFGTNPVDLGVRVEVPAEVLMPMTDVLYEVKLEYYTKCFEDKVRTFCMNPGGEVVKEHLDDVITVNGHSYKEKLLPNTNFAILVSTYFTEPFKDPVAYGKHVAKLANLLSGGIIVQRFGDLVSGHRSTPERMQRGIVRPSLVDSVPGDLNAVLPRRHLESIIEFLQLLDKFAPGVGSRDTLLYGVEVKFYSMRPKLSTNLESEVQNLFMAGDGAGITRGLFQAAMAGLVVADAIKERCM
jgi:uncharacterized FAD-dependent dehydrogenase